MRIWFHGVVHRLLLLRGCGRSVGVCVSVRLCSLLPGRPRIF
ncbi:unnamed protein product [Tenebrio molitor]|nr:unnamed protein product [Tenebrio molitor]